MCGPACAVGAVCRSVRAAWWPGAGPGTDRGCLRARGVRPVRNHGRCQLFRWRGDGPLAWSAGPDLTGPAVRRRRPSREVEADVRAELKSVRSGSACPTKRSPACGGARSDALAAQGARRRPVAGRAAGDGAGTRPLLGGGVGLARVRGEAERAAAVHHRDRRGRYPFHPRQVAVRGRAAADRDARLARVGHRAARGCRAAGRRRAGTAAPPGTRSTWCCRPCPATASPPGRPRPAGSRPGRAGVGGADAPPRLYPVRRPGRRRGRLGHRRAAVRRSDRDHVPGQHHRVLADRHRGLGRPVVRGERTSPGDRGRAAATTGQAPGRLHHLPRRSSPPRAAGPSRDTPPSATSTRPPGAATSPPGTNPGYSQPRSGRRSSRCADRNPHLAKRRSRPSGQNQKGTNR